MFMNAFILDVIMSYSVDTLNRLLKIYNSGVMFYNVSALISDVLQTFCKITEITYFRLDNKDK